MTKNDEITELNNLLQPLVPWIEKYLHPYKYIVITKDGVRVISDDYGMTLERSEQR